MMMNLMMRLWKDEEGQGLVEYGLIIALVSIMLITVLGLLAGDGTEDGTTGLTGVFNTIRSAFD